jgi:hypothetical protein
LGHPTWVATSPAVTKGSCVKRKEGQRKGRTERREDIEKGTVDGKGNEGREREDKEHITINKRSLI